MLNTRSVVWDLSDDSVRVGLYYEAMAFEESQAIRLVLQAREMNECGYPVGG